MRRHRHQAMGTQWELWLPGDGSHAAQAAFERLDEIESELSHFRESSDLSRLNRAPAGQAVRLGAHCFDCLQHAKRLWRWSEGAFDPGVAASFTGGATETNRTSLGMDSLSLDPEASTATKRQAGLRIDLGAIGKGFALDGMAERLRTEWEVSEMLLHSGSSTILARGARAYPVGIEASAPYRLQNQALSTSGTAIRGAHIVDGRSGKPAAGRERVWALAKTATDADALSTAFLVLNERAIRGICEARGVAARWKGKDGRWSTAGHWRPPS